MSIQVNNKNLGHATAYAYAVAGGYTGTEAEFIELLGNIADDLEQIENLTVTVETLAAGSSATASYSNGVLHLGIPKGDKGDKGDTGATGPTGPTGNGIASVAKTGTSGLVDTYTITYTNGNTSTFTVTNGAEAVDNTLTIAGRAADAKKTGDEISELKEDLNESLPHAKVIEFQNKTFSTLTGTITTDNPTRLISELLDIQEGDTFSMDSGYKYEVFRFDRQGTYLANPIAWTNGNTQFVATSSYGNYLHRIYVRKNDSVSAITANEIGITFDIASIQDTYFNVEDKIDNKYSGLLALKKEWKTVEQKTGTVTTGKFLKIDGTETSSDAWNYRTLNVNSGEQYAVSAYAGLDARLWLILSANDSVLLYSTDNSSISLKTEIITIPSGGAKLIVNAEVQTAAEINAILIEKVDILNVVEEKSVPDNLLSGKVLCCVGDSITYGTDMDSEGITNVSNITMYQCNNSGVFSEVTSRFRKTWGYQIAERNNMIFYNGGVSGSTMQGENGVNGFSLANGRYTKLPDIIDYLVIWFGWNDTAYGTLGTIDDDTNESYYGGYNVVLPYLINKYPYAKIALVVPYGTDANHREAIRLLGNKWGVAVWDNLQGGTPLYYNKENTVGVDESIATANRAKFQANGAHPNYKGHTQLADMIEHFLQGI